MSPIVVDSGGDEAELVEVVERSRGSRTIWGTRRTSTLKRCWFRAPEPPHQSSTSRLPDQEKSTSPSWTTYSDGR